MVPKSIHDFIKITGNTVYVGFFPTSARITKNTKCKTYGTLKRMCFRFRDPRNAAFPFHPLPPFTSGTIPFISLP